MQPQLAFLDEWGNKGLDFTRKGVSTHFIIAAVTLPKDRLPEAVNHVENVRRRYFQTGPIKSKGVGRNDGRRLEILRELLKAPFQIMAVVVDKRQLTGQGFQYGSSFFKFLHALADRELYRTFPDLELVADQHGSDTFMEGFVRYVHDKHVPLLFSQATFAFVNDKDTTLIQAADFVAGSLARCYDETKMSNADELMAVFKPKLAMLRYWPETYTPIFVSTTYTPQQYDATLAGLSMHRANDFIHRKANSHIAQDVDQFTTLNYLLFVFRHISPIQYVSSRELMQQVEARRGRPVNLHYFQTKIIASLRDAGVLIASSPKGYKLPASERDLYEFINHSNSIVQPLLARLKRCRELVLLATNGSFDPLNQPEYDSLKRLLDEPPA